MGYKRNRNSKQNNNNKDKRSYKEYTAEMKPMGGPIGEKTPGVFSTTVSKLAMRQLAKSSYSFLSDPYASQVPGTREYEILTSFNPVFGPNYGGERNIDGGTITSYVTSNQSKFLSCPDCATMPVNINYRYLPITKDDDRGHEIAKHMMNVISDTISLLDATTFTNQEFLKYGVITNMPLPGVGADRNVAVDGYEGVKMYTDPTAVIYSTAIVYQIMLQELAHVIDAHSSWRACQGEMMRMSYDRDTSSLNRLFSIMNKAAFLNNVDSVAGNFDGEFFDTEWRVQANTLANVKSRRSQGVLDPLIEVEANYNMPDYFQLIIPVYDSQGVYTSHKVVFDLNNPVYETRKYSLPENSDKVALNFKELVSEWTSMNSVTNTLRLVRDGTIKTTHYFNVCMNLISCISQVFDVIKKSFSDFKTVIKTLIRPGVITWATNFRPRLLRDTDFTLCNYLIVNHIIKETFSGAAEITFNNSTSRYQSFVLWDLYYGIPSYSLFQGGAFVTFSAKGQNVIQESDLKAYLPVAFTLGDMVDIKTGVNVGPALRMINRKGQICYITRQVVTGSKDPDIVRMFPVPMQENLKIYMPICPLSAVPGDSNQFANLHSEGADAEFANHIERVMMNLFGMAEVWYPAFEDIDAHISVSVSPDIVSVYQYEINDLSADMQTYAKANGPFRGVPTDTSNIGFLSMGGNNAER